MVIDSPLMVDAIPSSDDPNGPQYSGGDVRSDDSSIKSAYTRAATLPVTAIEKKVRSRWMRLKGTEGEDDDVTLIYTSLRSPRPQKGFIDQGTIPTSKPS